jgi:adenylate kinase family enzyme
VPFYYPVPVTLALQHGRCKAERWRGGGMVQLLIFGNSGSGKSSLAQSLARRFQVAHLDLDSLAWLPSTPPVRAPVAQCQRQMAAFCAEHEGWVIEGCYGDLLQLLLADARQILFLDLPVRRCIDNARRRPWEPHKYASRAAQDANLPMLEGWIADYEHRDDVCSRRAHEALYERFAGWKRRLRHNCTAAQVLQLEAQLDVSTDPAALDASAD